jgi:hypothetical protein
LTSLVKVIACTDRKFEVLREGEFSTSRKIVAQVPQGFILAPVLYGLYINVAPIAPGTHLALFMDNTCIYMTEKHENHVLCKLQHRLTVVNSWCEHWTTKIKEVKTQVISFSRRLRVPDDVQLNRRDIPFINNVMYLGVTFDRTMTWRHHNERTVAKAFCMYIRSYSLFRSWCLSTNIKFMLYKALIRSVTTCVCPTWEYAMDAYPLKLQHLQNRVFHTIGNLDSCTPASKLHVAFKIPYMYDYVCIRVGP